MVIKISGACTLSHEPFPYPDIWEPLSRIFNAYGLDRCLWGTDWTRAVRLLTYEQGVEAFRVTDRSRIRTVPHSWAEHSRRFTTGRPGRGSNPARRPPSGRTLGRPVLSTIYPGWNQLPYSPLITTRRSPRWTRPDRLTRIRRLKCLDPIRPTHPTLRARGSLTPGASVATQRATGLPA